MVTTYASMTVRLRKMAVVAVYVLTFYKRVIRLLSPSFPIATHTDTAYQ